MSYLWDKKNRSEITPTFGLNHLNGVSTRKVTKITEELCGVSFSKSTVSQLCLELGAKVDAWNNRTLSNNKYPFIIVDGMFVKLEKILEWSQWVFS